LAELAELLAQAAAGKAPQLVLFEGDEYLARAAARELAEALVPQHDRAFNLIVLDASAGAREIVSNLITVAMFAAPKAIVVEGAEALAEEVDGERELARARELWQGKRQRDAARRLLKLASAAGWSAADLAYGLRGAATAARWRKEIVATVEDSDKGWLQELAAYAQAQKIAAPPADLDVLVQTLARGLPPKTHLLLVAEALPPRHPLARIAAERGVTVRRKAERRGRGIETLDISQLVADELGPHKKRLARDAENELKQRLGDDLRLIAAELAKLALAVGDRPQITRADVEEQVAPVREEEFFALGEAVGEGNLARALALFGDELRRKANVSAVALPFLGGIAGAVRRALYDHARYASIPEARTRRELGYDEYQRSVFPAVEAETSAKGQKVPNPYGAYLGYKRARRLPRAHWRRALVLCAEADQAIKDGADGRLLLERLLTNVCVPRRA
jgi:DNA polymerase III delta subunit